MRIFIAFPLPPEVKAAVKEVVTDLQGAFPKLPVLWIREENLHVTLEFLGDINSAQLLTFSDIIQEEVLKTPTINFVAEKIDCFPDFSKPEVFVLRVAEKNGEASYELRRQIQKKLIESNITPDEKSWQPHITLGRTKKRSDLNINFFEHYTPAEIAWQADSIDLFDSTLTPEGAIYEKLKSFTLKK